MERLTGRELNSLGCVHYNKCHQENCHGNCADCEITYEAELKLKAYEDAEEHGLLLRLPCKIGDTVYVIAQSFDMENNTSRYKVFTRHIDQIRGNKLNPIYFVTDGSDSFVPSSIGKRVFLTKEEAEQALAKMKEV